jgi:hypothetical protein
VEYREGEVRDRIRKAFSTSGKIECVVSYYGEKMSKDDSTVFIYDKKDRLTQVTVFNYSDSVYVVNAELRIKYDELTADHSTHQLNDTLIHEYLPYESFDFKFFPDRFPSEISFKYAGRTFSPKEAVYYYTYDEKGRLTAIGGFERISSGLEEKRDIVINYSGKDVAVLDVYWNNSKGKRVSFETYEYNKGLMVRRTYNNDEGHPYESIIYKYTFYK